MKIFHRIAKLNGVFSHPLFVKFHARLYKLLEIASLNKFHNGVNIVAVLDKVDHLRYVIMLEILQHVHLGAIADTALYFVLDKLYGDKLFHSFVIRLKNYTARPRAKLFGYFICIVQSLS